MSVPLIAMSGPYTFNQYSKQQQVIIWQDGEKKVVPSPREICYYTPNGKESYNILGRAEWNPMSLDKHIVDNVSKLSPELLPGVAYIDGVSRNEVERICIEEPDFFKKFPSKKIKSLCYDLEVTSADGTFPYGEKHPIVAIGYTTSDGHREALIWDELKEDKDIILEFAKFIKEYDPDIIYGYNVIGYDVPQLLARAKHHKINLLPYLNREERNNYGWEVDFSYHKKARISAWGRLIVDVYNFTSKDYFLSGKDKRLKTVARAYGLDPLELDFAANDILDYDIDEVKEYVLSDVDITKYLFNHYFPQHLFIAELLQVPLETLINGSDSFITKILQGRALYKQKILTIDKNIDRHPTVKSFQAAHIQLYKDGFHAHNYKVDFASMYPSIAMALNLGPDTTRIIRYEDYDVTKFGCKSAMKSGRYMELTIPDNVLNKNVVLDIDLLKKSCLYQMCKQFKEMREPYKRQNTKEAKSKSNALKIMVNTFYGANTNPYMSYGDVGVGIAITGIARWLILGAKKIISSRYGNDSVVYIHTDGINTSCDIDVEWINSELRKAMDSIFPLGESEWILVDKDKYKEGYWIKIGNYVLRNLDGSLTKHGATFKSKSRSDFYTKVLDKIIEGRLSNTVDHQFIEKLYDFSNYTLGDFLQLRNMNKDLKEYKADNDLIVQLAREAKEINMNVGRGTTFSFYKTQKGYKLEQQVSSMDEIDIKYHWNIINNLLTKFGLKNWLRKTPSLTVMDKKQRQLMDFI